MAKKSSQTINLYKIVVGFLFVFLVALRLWKSAEWFSFNFDEEYQALLAWSQVKDFHLIWIGVSASNFGFYLGPAFTYLNALLFWISRGDLSILAYFSSVFGILTTLSLYYVSANIFSKKVGVISSIIYGFSAFLIYFDHRFWNPTPIPFITIWLLFSLYKSQKDTRWFILSGIFMAAGLHIHLSLLVFWPLVIYRILKSIKKISISTWVLSFVSYLVIVSPLIVFDINHNFDDLLGPIRYLLGPKTSGTVFGADQLIYHLQNTWLSLGRILSLNWFTSIQDEHGLGVHATMSQPAFLISLFSCAALIWHFYSAIIKKHFGVITAMISLILLFYLFYPSIGCEYYLLSFFIMQTIIIAIFLEKLSWKILVPLLAIYIVYNSITIFTTTQKKYGLLARRDLVNQVMVEIGDRPFRLETVGIDPRSYHPYGGWRYIFKTYGETPASSFADEFFGWIYRDELTAEKPVYRVVVSEDIPYIYDFPPVSIATSGAFTAYIFRLD